jgi:hypothetical protein
MDRRRVTLPCHPAAWGKGQSAKKAGLLRLQWLSRVAMAAACHDRWVRMNSDRTELPMRQSKSLPAPIATTLFCASRPVTR